MVERRRNPRTLTFRTGTITAAGIADIGCAVLDISESGARILVPDAAQIPATFGLTLDPNGVTCYCKVAWKAGNKVGVSFDAAPNKIA